MWWIPLAVTGANALSKGMAESGQSAQINRNIRDANAAIGDIKGNIQGQSQWLQDYTENAYQPYTQNASTDFNAYRDAIMSGQDFQFNEAPDFNYNLQAQTQQFLDPMLDAKIQSATDNLQASAANRGGLFSSATGRNIAETAAEMKGAGWKEALQMALEDRGFQYGVHSDDITRDRESTRFAADQYASKLQGLGNLAGMGQKATLNLADNVMSIKGDEFKGLNEADLAQAANLMKKQREKGFLETMMPMGGALIEGLFSEGGPLGGGE